jgi:hypothetical protein
MFAKAIVKSDAFLDLPISSQALYFHLGMEADDRGYVNNARSIIRLTGASVGDIEQLAHKKFILIRGENLILIKHWKINNYLQSDRVKETRFTEDLKKLFFDENNSYTEKITDKPCIQGGYNVYTQNSIDKYSIGKDSIEENSINNNVCVNKEENNNKTYKCHLNRIFKDFAKECSSCLKRYSCELKDISHIYDDDPKKKAKAILENEKRVELAKATWISKED